MTSSNEHPLLLASFGEPTTRIPGDLDSNLLAELSTPQERYDNGWKRGYMAGYAEGARAAEAERAAGLAAHKTTWAAKESRVSALLGQLEEATAGYLASFGDRDLALTERLLAAAFDLAEAVVGCELHTRPALALDVARAALADMPAGPAIVHVNPVDLPVVEEAAKALRPSLEHLTYQADETVGAGGCIVSSGARTADARIEEALSRARAALLAESPPAAERGRIGGVAL
jgi:flagellar assembly protein FliH